MNTIPLVSKIRVSRAGLLCTALLAATAFTAQAQNTGFGTITPASKVTVKGNLAVGSSTFIPTAAPTNGAIIQGFTGIGVVVPSHQLHVFSTFDPVRFEGLQTSADDADVPLVVTSTGVVKKSDTAFAPVTEYIQLQANTENRSYSADTPLIFGDVELAKYSPSNLFTNVTTTTVTLQPGRTYRLTATVPFVDNDGPGSTYRFHNDTAGAYFGPKGYTADLSGGGAGATLGLPGHITTYITPANNLPATVSLRTDYVAAGSWPRYGLPHTLGSPIYEELGVYITIETVR